MCKLGWGPNIEKLEHQFLQTIEVEVGPNTENFEMKFYRQCKLAGPQHNKSLVVLYLFCLTSLIAI
ncbi:hypothetical protein SAB1933 [Staphylococcus aureus RF122]|nr:hypothetical protein SAB1933 [Staphylococcus aureus RF122]